jgi:hypothetical protein
MEIVWVLAQLAMVLASVSLIYQRAKDLVSNGDIHGEE